MRRFFLSALFASTLLFLASCETIPDPSHVVPPDPETGFAKRGKTLLFDVNHTAYEVFGDVFSTDFLSKGEYSTFGVPLSATDAVFVVSNEPDESNNYGFYAEDTGNAVIIYETAYDPGFLHDPSWRRLKKISY